MDYSAFHFADSTWLWGLLVIPLAAIAYSLFYRPSTAFSRLERFADRHLLPHLLTGKDKATGTIWRSLLLWSLLWTCGILAMAGPRWNYVDLQTFKPEQNLVVLLDLSKSMDAQDVKPSRMEVAREKLGDLIKMAKGTNVGLVGYAADAHMISPITDDTKPVLDILPELNTSLPYVQGNNLKPALVMAEHMLDAEPGNNKSILIISDGGFRDGNIKEMLNDTVGKDTAIYTMGVGTEEGAPIPAAGGWIKSSDGKMIISRLRADRLQALSDQRGGLYVKAGYTDDDIRAFLGRIDSRDKAGQATQQKARVWEEHFYILVMIMALLILPWFRRGYGFPAIAFLVFIFSSNGADAAQWQNLFLNKAQQAHAEFNKGDYKNAAATFDTPYRQGVAEYRAGNFQAAEKSFTEAESTTPEAQYNLGNTQVMQQKYADAIASYESVLKHDPHNANASHNLEIARKLLQLQKQQQQNQNKETNQRQKEQNSSSQQSGKDKQQKDQQNSASGTGEQHKKQQDKENNATASNKEGNEQQKQNEEKQSASQQQSRDNKQQASEEQQGQDNQQSSQPQSAKAEGKEKQGSPDGKQAQEQPQNAQQNPGNTGMKEGSGNENKMMMAGQDHPRTQKDIDADQWLNRIENDPQSFLKNQFQIETLNNGTKEGDEPW